jgi:hypothetical protein
MAIESKESKGKIRYIWGWILDIFGCLLLVIGGLFTLAGIVLIVVSIIDPPTGGDGLFFVFNLCLGVGLLLIGPLLLLIGTKIISRKKV